MTSVSETFTLTYETKGRLPSLPFVSMKDAVLGSHYALSLVVVSATTMRTLNRTYRNKDVPTDILSFPLDETTGEIFINIEYAKKEAKKFNRPFENFIGFLFIHGLVHLAGFTHGSKMESEEKRIREKFAI